MKSKQKSANQNGLIKTATVVAGILAVLTTAGRTQDTTITVNADQVLHTNSPYLTGACLEDVNHEIYGGIDSQMIFGESFAEPGAPTPLQGFTTYDGRWTLTEDGGVQAVGSDGSKILWNGPAISAGEVSVDVRLADGNSGNGGLIFKVSNAGIGPDAFTGYEVSLERPGFLVVGRHRQNWEPIRRLPCAVPANEWITLTVRTKADSFEILVNGQSMLQFEDADHPLETGAVGLRIWRQDVSFRNLSISAGGPPRMVAFAYEEGGEASDRVSGMWRPIRQGGVKGGFSVESTHAFSGNQSQRITFAGGSGVIGIANQSLNHWGMNFVKGKKYEGYLWARAQAPAEIVVALEGTNGSSVYAEKHLTVPAGGWQRVAFSLRPDMADRAGQFSVKLKQPGSITLGYAFLQPGSWARFKDLPVRKDVVEGLIHQGVTILRYGGSMVNDPEYRWKNMIGTRAQRPPYVGHWYPYSSDGWGIFDFLNLCEAAGFVGIPDLDINESPKDMADFMDYLNGAGDGEWGRRRVADGHPAPYRLKYIELGNEERVDDDYFAKFKAVAEVIWAKDPAIILIVGDFAYHNVITDPFHFTGADGGITSLAGQQKILQLARQNGREVWFDLHVWTDGPRPDSTLAATFSYIDALDKIADGAQHKVLVFELNALNHSQRRALANALAINAIQRDGRLPITCSANCLQPDGENDNDWNQGLLFLNPSQVWLQPPGYVTKMYSAHYQPRQVWSAVSGANKDVDASAQISSDGRELVLEVVNAGDRVAETSLNIHGFSPAHLAAEVEELSGPLDEVNTATAPRQIQPLQKHWQPVFTGGETKYEFQPRAITIMKFE